jgi:hypothetical protein
MIACGGRPPYVEAQMKKIGRITEKPLAVDRRGLFLGIPVLAAGLARRVKRNIG